MNRCRMSWVLLCFVLAGCNTSDAAPESAAQSTGAEARLAEGTAPSYVGLRYSVLPDSLEKGSGGVMDSHTGPGSLWVSQVDDRQGPMIWLNGALHRDEDGTPHWEVLAVQRLVKPVGEEFVSFGYCEHRGEVDNDDTFTFAVVKREEKEMLTEVREAWRLDVAQHRFTPLPPHEVECYNLDYFA
jgi:hypothetical protein